MEWNWKILCFISLSSNQKAIGEDDFTKIPNGVNGVEDRRMSVIWKVSFLPKLCCYSFPLWSRRVAVIFVSKNFFFLHSRFYRPLVFIRPHFCHIQRHPLHSGHCGSSPCPSCYFQWTDRVFLTYTFSLPIPSSLDQRLVLKNCEQLVLSTEFLRSLEKFGHFPVCKCLEKNFFGLLVWKKKVIFQTWSFDMHSDNVLF